MKTIHLISASDSSSGAGMQRDIMTTHDHGVWPVCSLTGVTVQTGSGVLSVQDADESMLKEQLENSVPFSPSVVKIGALFSLGSLKLVLDYLEFAKPPFVIFDPVFKPSGGFAFYKDEMVDLFLDRGLRLVDLVTPNLTELEVIFRRPFNTLQETAEYVFKKKLPVSFFLTGGHVTQEGDYISEALIHETIEYLQKPKTTFNYSHGTGCTFSTATACNISRGYSLLESCRRATEYVDKIYMQY